MGSRTTDSPWYAWVYGFCNMYVESLLYILRNGTYQCLYDKYKVIYDILIYHMNFDLGGLLRVKSRSQNFQVLSRGWISKMVHHMIKVGRKYI